MVFRMSISAFSTPIVRLFGEACEEALSLRIGHLSLEAKSPVLAMLTKSMRWVTRLDIKLKPTDTV
jgi:hypothetical protein